MFDLLFIYCVGERISTLMSFSDGLGSFFPSEDGKDIAYKGRNGWKGVFFPPESTSNVFVVEMIEVLFPICTSTLRVNNYVYC